MKTRRLFGIILLLAAFVMAVYVLRLGNQADKRYDSNVELAVRELRQTLRAPADSLLARFEPLRIHPPLGNEIFLDFLKEATNRHEIIGGFVELPTQALMDPSDTSYAAAEMMGPMALSTPTNLKIPPGELTEDFLKTMEARAEQKKPIDNMFHLHLDGPPPSDWAIRAYISPHNDKVHLAGFAFPLLQTLQPYSLELLNQRVLGGVAAIKGITIELVNPADEPAYSTGSIAGKKVIRQIILDPSDVGYSGWKVNAWAAAPGKLYLILSIMAGIVGIVLAIWR
jgi:hypothetical protein